MKHLHLIACSLLLVLSSGAYASLKAATTPASTAVEGLRCEYLSNPLGIDTPNPRLTWRVRAAGAGFEQAAYRVLVASTPEILAQDRGDLWDSGRVAGAGASPVVYAGDPLESRQACYWKVRVWGASGERSDWSAPGHWEMALLEPADWEASWIRHPDFLDDEHRSRPAPYFRKTFRVDGAVKEARAYFTGLGYFELTLNGEKVGDHILDPVKTRYDRSLRYVTHDITDLLRPGENTVGLVLGTGWYNHFANAVWDFNQAPWRTYPEAFGQLEIETGDRRLVVPTDGSWRTAQGPIRFDGIRNGEVYDARLEMPGWDSPGFDDRGWREAVEVPGPDGSVRAQMIQPIRETREVKPVSMREVEPGVWVFDLGQNIAGYTRLKVSGPRGTAVSMKMGERLWPDGTVEQKQILRFLQTPPAAQTDTYILKGVGEETWNPRFVYHGFQYIEVRGLPAPPTLETVTGVVLNTDFGSSGSFGSSDPVLNRLQQNMIWSFIGNYHGLPTDCPHREKIGWTGDAQLVAETGLFYFDTVRAYLKWLDDFADEQQPSGDIPSIIPSSGWGYEHGRRQGNISPIGYGPQWDGAFIQITWDLYRFTGDPLILERYYAMARRYLDFLIANAEGHLLTHGIDDHKPVVTKTEGDYLSSGYLVGYTAMFSRMADILGKAGDAKKYAAYSEKARQAFHEHYYDPATARYGNGGQTAQALALYFDIPPADQRARVMDRLLDAVREHDFHFDAGVVGLKFLFNVLRESGHSEWLYRMVTQTDFPGFAYWLEQGANTLWQDWDGSMSLNHIMFATVNEWFFEGITGIQIDEDRPGFKHFTVRPDMLPALDWANAAHRSLHGEVAVSWQKRPAGGLVLRVVVPPNTTASVHVPAKPGAAVLHNGKRVADPDRAADRARFSVTSGEHLFEVEPTAPF